MVKVLGTAYDSVNVHGRFGTKIKHSYKPFTFRFLGNNGGSSEPAVFPFVSPTLARGDLPERLAIHLMNKQLLHRRKTRKIEGRNFRNHKLILFIQKLFNMK